MAAAKCKIFQSTFVGDENWGQMWSTIKKGKQPFKYIDRLEIAFADIDSTNPDNAFLVYSGANSQKVVDTVDEARRENAGIGLIAQMNWAEYLAPLVEDAGKAKSRLDAFAKSIPGFLKKYKLQGIDFDWESVPAKMTTDNATYLFTQTKKYLSESDIRNPIMTITPDGPKPTGQSLNIDVVNRLFDAVIVQSYERVNYIDNYIKAKIKSSILFCGICSEKAEFYPPNGDITKYIQKLEQYKLPGLYCWRIDNDDTDLALKVPRYTITSKMWTYSRGSPPQPPLFP